MNSTLLKKIIKDNNIFEEINFSVNDKEYIGIFTGFKLKDNDKKQLIEKYGNLDFFDIREGEEVIREKYTSYSKEEINKLIEKEESGEIDWYDLYEITPTTIYNNILVNCLGTVILEKEELILSEETEIEHLEYF